MVLVGLNSPVLKRDQNAGEGKILPSYGAKGGWHRVYTGEIVEAYQKTIDN